MFVREREKLGGFLKQQKREKNNCETHQKLPIRRNREHLRSLSKGKRSQRVQKRMVVPHCARRSAHLKKIKKWEPIHGEWLIESFCFYAIR